MFSASLFMEKLIEGVSHTGGERDFGSNQNHSWQLIQTETGQD